MYKITQTFEPFSKRKKKFVLTLQREKNVKRVLGLTFFLLFRGRKIPFKNTFKRYVVQEVCVEAPSFLLTAVVA